jgi:hypothetical protein
MNSKWWSPCWQSEQGQTRTAHPDHQVRSTLEVTRADQETTIISIPGFITVLLGLLSPLLGIILSRRIGRTTYKWGGAKAVGQRPALSAATLAAEFAFAT